MALESHFYFTSKNVFFCNNIQGKAMKFFFGKYIQPGVSKEEEKVRVKLEDGFITLEFEDIMNNPSLSFECLDDFWKVCEEENIIFTEETKKDIEEEMLHQPLIFFDIGPDSACDGCERRKGCNNMEDER